MGIVSPNCEGVSKMKEALISALKELGRVVVLAIIPVVASAIESGSIDYRAIAIVAALAILRFADKYLHELEPEGKAGGLVRF